MPVDAQPPNEPVAEEDNDHEEGGWPALFEFLDTDRGHELANRILAVFEKHKERDATLRHRAWRLSTWVQAAVFVIALGVAAYLDIKGHLDPAIATLIGTLVGYILGRRQNG